MSASTLTIVAIIGPVFDKAAAVVFVCGVLAALYWKVLSPLATLITTINKQFIPNVQYMGDLPKINKILTVVEAMAGQFRRDDGSTMKDDMDALAGYAVENRMAAAAAKEAASDAKQAAIEARQAGVDAAAAATAAAKENAHTNASGIATLEVLVGTIKERADDDRQLARSDRDLARDAIERTLERMRDIMASATRTEESGARIEIDRASVAEDLAAARKSADDVHEDAEPGTAADAASQSPESPESAGEQ